MNRRIRRIAGRAKAKPIYIYIGILAYMAIKFFQLECRSCSELLYRIAVAGVIDTVICGHLEDGLLSKYIKSDVTLFCSRLMPAMRKLKSELNEHRYYLERNVELRTTHLLRQIAMLESCNATLCARLEAAQRGIEDSGQETVSPVKVQSHTFPSIADQDSKLAALHPIYISQGESHETR